MLAIPESKKCFVCACDKCGTEPVYTDEEMLDAAADVMKGAGWLEMPTAGKPREKYGWLCPTCKPKPSSGFMPSTP